MAERAGGPDVAALAYQLVDFLSESSLDRLERSRARAKRRKSATTEEGARGGRPIVGGLPSGSGTRDETPGREPDARSLFERFQRLFTGVTLARLHGTVTPGKTPRYVYDVGLDATRTVGFLLKNPFDTVLTFGPARGEATKPSGRPAIAPLELLHPTLRQPTLRAPALVARATVPEPTRKKARAKKGTIEPPRRPGAEPAGEPVVDHRHRVCDFNARIVVSPKNVLEVLQIFGPRIRLHLSTGLVRPVRRDERGDYVPLQGRQSVGLGDRVITLARGRAPMLSGPLRFEPNLVRVGGQRIVVRLNEMTLGGTWAEPKMIFDRTEIMLGSDHGDL